MYKLTEILLPGLPQSDLIAADPEWTRAGFNRAVLGLSACLKQAGVQTAALWFDDAAEFACAVLAAWHAGAAVLLPPNLAQENADWGGMADVWLTDVPRDQMPPALSDRHCVWNTVWRRQNMQECAEGSGHPLIPAGAQACLKTSGSSGKAQIIVKTAAQMEAEACMLAAAVPFGGAGIAAVGSVSPQHMYGFTFRFALALTMGWTMIRGQKPYPETLLAAAAAQEKSVWIASPAVLNRLGSERNWQEIRGKVAGIVSAGGALPEATAALLERQAVRPFEVYGSTETGVIASRRHGARWQPFAGARIGQDGGGALWVQSPWSGGRCQTADEVEMGATGFLLLGRKDRIIKFEDKRVSLNQIEHDLLAHPWIADACCGRHPKYGRPAVWAALNAEGVKAFQEEGRAAVAGALKRHLAATQDRAALPRYWRFAGSLPRNAQSKIAAADFTAAFAAMPTAPEWQECLSEKEGVYRFRGLVPLDLVYFGGHFAEFPLVPGVVELQWVRDLAERFDWGRRSVVRVENLKYQQFLRPNDTVSAVLQYDAEKDKLVFLLERAGAPCASGRIVFGGFGI